MDVMPRAKRELIADIAEAAVDNPEKYALYQQVMRLSDGVEFNIAWPQPSRGVCIAGRIVKSVEIARTGIECPDTLSWRSSNPTIPCDCELMQAVILMTYYYRQVHAERFRISLAISSYLGDIRTVGQLRRDWPELLSILPASMTTALGTTTARKPTGSRFLPSPTERDVIMDGLARAACLDDDVGTSASNILTPMLIKAWI